MCSDCFILSMKLKNNLMMKLGKIPTDDQDTDGFIRPEVQHPDKDFTRVHADIEKMPGAD